MTQSPTSCVNRKPNISSWALPPEPAAWQISGGLDRLPLVLTATQSCCEKLILCRMTCDAGLRLRWWPRYPVWAALDLPGPWCHCCQSWEKATPHFGPPGCDSLCLAHWVTSSWVPAAPGAQVRTDGASTLFTRPLYIHQGATLGAFNKQEIQVLGMKHCLRQTWHFSAGQSSEWMGFQR